MDQLKTGAFLKELRKEKGMTQEKLADMLMVNSRTVSRWENGRTMPDFDMLIELAKLYDVSMEELLNGERTEKIMEKQTENTLLEIADYTNQEKARLLKNQHYFAWVGLVCWLIFLGLEAAGLADEGITESIASFAAGVAFGMSILMVIYTGRHIDKIRSFKMKLLKKQQELS